MSNKKNEIIQLSFKNNSMEEQLLLQWIKDNAVMMGKSTFIKSIAVVVIAQLIIAIIQIIDFK